MNEFLLQLMTGALDDREVIEVFNDRDAEGNLTVILLHNNVPVMLQDKEATSYLAWRRGWEQPLPVDSVGIVT